MLDPPRPTTEAATRLTAQIATLRDTLSRLAQRAGTAVGEGDPTGVARAGFLYIDSLNGHVWVSATPNGWVTADMQRAANFDGSTYCTTGTTGDLAGPNVTIHVPPNGYIGIFADAELQAVGTAAASLWIYDAVDVPASALLLQSSSASFTRMVPSSASNFGTSVPYGEWIVYPATGGWHTLYPRYVSAIAGQQVCFRNRRIWVVTF
jgi:hypothetical protein